MRILILSLSRSASTAIYYDVLRCLPFPCKDFFEPNIKPFLASPLPSNTLAKVILDHLDPDDLSVLLDKFDKVLLMIRDPRDRLISAMLFAMHGVDRPLFSQRLAELDIKRQHPERYPFLDLVENIFTGWSRQEAVTLIQLHYSLLRIVLDSGATLQTLRYENYIASGLANIFDDVLIQQETSVELPERHAYGKRKASVGDWKNWFTLSDVEFFKPVLSEYLSYFGYSDEWRLNSHPVIHPEHSTEFVKTAYEKDQEFRQKGITWHSP